MKTTMLQGEKWRQYGVMVKDTPETLGGMLRIERKNGSVLGDAVAFAIDQETADTIVKAVNCHDDLLEACKVLLQYSKAWKNWEGKVAEMMLNRAILLAEEAVTKATPQKEGAK